MLKFILAGLVACSALATPALANAEKGEPCLNNRLIDGFEKATRSSVVLTQSGNKKFLVTTVGACTGLDYAEQVATVSHTTCFTPGDKIVFNDGAMRQSCMAKDVTYLPETAAK